MPSKIAATPLRIQIEPLTPSSFAPFGSVIQNPARHTGQHASVGPLSANQGTALKYIDASQITNFYSLAPSRKAAKAVCNVFVCHPRELRQDNGWTFLGPHSEALEVEDSEKELFDVNILERHPYTSQTFIPMGLSASDTSTQYLVIVAPTLSAAQSSKQGWQPPYPIERQKKRPAREVYQRARPSPFTNEREPPQQGARKPTEKLMKGAGRPDLKNVRAFLATGDQAVTYLAGTWHAPMVVLGDEDVDFVVMQYSNGVGLEDCQEVELQPATEHGEGISVEIEHSGGVIMAKPQLMKAKL